MKKVVIIGAGAAGISLAISLKRNGHSVKIFEKRNKASHNGLALLLLSNGFNALRELGLEQDILKKIRPLHNYRNIYSTGQSVFSEDMHELFGAKRHDIVSTLRDQLNEGDVVYGHEFSHFHYDADGCATAVHFTNGHKEEADIFIGADGANSRIRKILFPQRQLSRINVKEVVSLVRAPELAQRLNTTFIKTTCKAGGRAVGLLPCSKEEVVWFFQFDETIIEFDPERYDLRSFMIHQLNSWANPVSELLHVTDFSKSYLWDTHDLNPLPRYHYNNVGLVGDAAHVFTTFTSQGLNTALEDGLVLGNIISEAPLNTPVNVIFDEYFKKRKGTAERHLTYGRNLKQQFLRANTQPEELMVPMANG
ncbi:MAG: NAD(P)/FAD-dependent oxidoreductase [Bacteroidota bacterium]